ncbi:histone acetyltransferase type B catalytic subunit [Phlyctochytrium arcticum]|nr:histone acetyltransferase type B catalytic subunit [Phlyctochytrium arcticum]
MTQEPSTKRRRIAAADEESEDGDAEEVTYGPFQTSSNEAIQLKLVCPDDASQDSEEFHPEFTYPIFGETETINGYQDLEVKLHYGMGSLELYLGVSYSKRDPMGPVDDIEALLRDKLPHDYHKSLAEYVPACQAAEASFVPPGTKVWVSEADAERQLEIYQCNFSTPRFREYHRRLQVFLLWYIEGASFIEEEDDRWEMALMFEKKATANGPRYAIVGYTTFYSFFNYPNRQRMRISQFIILPPFQGRGYGETLYRTLYQRFLDDPKIAEITVEDPNEEFSTMRDKCDLIELLTRKVFADLRPPIDQSFPSRMAIKYKLSKRQVERCMEMALLRSLNRKDKKMTREVRLLIKRRLFKHNEEALMTLEKEVRLEKLDESYSAVEEDHLRILDKIKKLSI